MQMDTDSTTWRLDVIGKLVSIETKVDGLIASRLDQEQRIRYLEKRNAMMVGACVIVSFVVPLITRKIGL